MRKTKRAIWWARGGVFVLRGPYWSEMEAWAAMRSGRPGQLFPDDVCVWPDDRDREELMAQLKGCVYKDTK